MVEGTVVDYGPSQTQTQSQLSMEERVNAIVSAFDVNNDGVISYEEFLMAMMGSSDLTKQQLLQTQSLSLVASTSSVSFQDSIMNQLTGLQYIEEGRIPSVSIKSSPRSSASSNSATSTTHIRPQGPIPAKTHFANHHKRISVAASSLPELSGSQELSMEVQPAHVQASTVCKQDAPTDAAFVGSDVTYTQSIKSISSSRSLKDESVFVPTDLQMSAHTVIYRNGVAAQHNGQNPKSEANAQRILSLLSKKSVGTMSGTVGHPKGEEAKLEELPTAAQTQIINEALLSASGKSTLIWSKGVLINVNHQQQRQSSLANNDLLDSDPHGQQYFAAQNSSVDVNTGGMASLGKHAAGGPAVSVEYISQPEPQHELLRQQLRERGNSEIFSASSLMASQRRTLVSQSSKPCPTPVAALVNPANLPKAQSPSSPRLSSIARLNLGLLAMREVGFLCSHHLFCCRHPCHVW
jgi:hypothetical protein